MGANLVRKMIEKGKKLDVLARIIRKIIFSQVRVPNKIFKIHGSRRRRIKNRRKERMNRRR